MADVIYRTLEGHYLHQISFYRVTFGPYHKITPNALLLAISEQVGKS